MTYPSKRSLDALKLDLYHKLLQKPTVEFSSSEANILYFLTQERCVQKLIKEGLEKSRK